MQSPAGPRMLFAWPACWAPAGGRPVAPATTTAAAAPAEPATGVRMHKVIVYLDDPAYARQQMPAAGGPTHWVLVACAPRMTHRISKWVSHSARENWRAKWADKLFGAVIPPLQERGDAVTPVLAKGPLPELTRLLMAEHGT